MNLRESLSRPGTARTRDRTPRPASGSPCSGPASQRPAQGLAAAGEVRLAGRLRRKGQISSRTARLTKARPAQAVTAADCRVPISSSSPRLALELEGCSTVTAIQVGKSSELFHAEKKKKMWRDDNMIRNKGKGTNVAAISETHRTKISPAAAAAADSEKPDSGPQLKA